MANQSAATTAPISASELKVSVTSSRITQVASAAVLGLFIVFAVGLAPMEVAHNAAHDTRHSFSFPCH